MLSLIRSGPKILIMASNILGELKEYIAGRFDTSPCTLDEAFEQSSEEFTIILVVENLKEIVHIDDIKYVFLIKEDSDVVLCSFHNDKSCNLINYTRIAPRILIMRALGNVEKVIEEIKKDHIATAGSFLEMLDNHNGKGTILALTQHPLNRKLSISDLYQTSLFIEEKYSPLRKNLRTHGLKYLNEGLGNKDWYELEIKIYDKFNEYMLHYQRLLKVIEYLELGIILGESWGKDTALVFKTVGIYRVRFFTFLDPKFIKKILLGLEYLDDKTRVVDYDVFYKRKKIYWTDVREENLKDKLDFSKKYRKHILNRLDENQLKEILELEKQILKTRY
ncbi:MAG: hypothetical protein PWQ67_2652 [Clostridia bacterium]|jgi:hypothetical protein|nr:hypothetical protein [Clostridia bacterium]